MPNIGDMQVFKRYDDDELEIVKADLKQFVVEEWRGKVAGWTEICDFESEDAAQEWLKASCTR